MPFKIVTDHASLKWLMGQKDLSGRLARWSLKLQGFDFEIEHRKGSANIVPDALSRAFVEELSTVVENDGNIDFSSTEFNSDRYNALKENVVENQDRLPDIKIIDQHVFKRSNGCLEKEAPVWKLWLPEGLQEKAVSAAHDPPLSGHRGYQKTLERVRSLFYWPKMANDVRIYVASCSTCKETKAPSTTLRPPMGNQIIVERPWQHICIDLLGPYPRSKTGNVSLFIVLDKYSKFVLLKPLRKANSDRINQYIKTEVFHTFGVPETILSDNGVQFRSKSFKTLLARYGVSHMRTATHSPQANRSERFCLRFGLTLAMTNGIGTKTLVVFQLPSVAQFMRQHRFRHTILYLVAKWSNMVQHTESFES